VLFCVVLWYEGEYQSCNVIFDEYNCNQHGFLIFCFDISMKFDLIVWKSISFVFCNAYWAQCFFERNSQKGNHCLFTKLYEKKDFYFVFV
jgi:hypothetical protein